MAEVINDLVCGYVTLAKHVLQYGRQVDVRGMTTRELTGFTFEVPASDEPPPMLPLAVNRGVNSKLAAIEALCMIGGVWRDDLIRKAAPQYGAVLVDASADAAAYAAYGPRIANQWLTVTSQLRLDQNTRQAIFQIWRPNDLVHRGDKPCTLNLQFLVRNDELECHVTMRSQDVWLGLAIDGFVFSQVQRTMAHQLGLKAGKYVHHVGSFHAYQRDWEKIEALEFTGLLPSHADLPDGVRVAPSRAFGAGPLLVAKDVLNGYADERNPWYVQRVKQVLERRPHATKWSPLT